MMNTKVTTATNASRTNNKKRGAKARKTRKSGFVSSFYSIFKVWFHHGRSLLQDEGWMDGVVAVDIVLLGFFDGQGAALHPL
jgi:hypothetical protein